jgi:broad specificity phosphatase PhoE
MSTTTAPILGYEALRQRARSHALPTTLQRFIFLRHGETDGNLGGRYQFPETPLNANGLAQAQHAAETLRASAISHIIASPMTRAWQTACSVAAHHDIVPEPDATLQERFYTARSGTLIHTMDWRDDPPGCEPLARFVDRTARGLIEALERNVSRGGDLLIVSHGGVFLVLSALADIAPDDPALRRNAIPLRVTHAAGRWTLAPISGGVD